ncbi:MAG: peptidase T [Spirochaetes bacterium GWD1_61_31]|nr:MAG: peptidase T [Spirochaetes bacterium GWB1_60_80]OHD43416.1 MAG: peptidase T [Spirochaetes bacterium GWD1_61_31]OHD46603.1 MAG: peptidase T [Spirochaetes bacterium GWE1_60_18]OHD61037.1 MAG: peptidase T [Spirochaetes bacterium GWF1_60_12]HAP44784.1 peptidase T [Spirochaetaceae bacterium]
MNDFTTILKRPFADELVERLVRYAKIESTCSHAVDTTPSTPCQWDMNRRLELELKAMGLKDVWLNEHCYLIATIPASPGCEDKPAIGFMAHIDTAEDVSGKGVNPKVVRAYDGKPLALSPGWTLDPAEFPELANYVGDTLVTSDGTTLLGADDKGGAAIIMTAVNHILKHPEIKHGPLYAIFTPDEEKGTGMNLFPLDRIKAVACYTLDGGRGGEIEAECFNAYAATAHFTGKASHPGYARGVMVNAGSMAAHFAALLPRAESPEATDEWFGYYYITGIEGSLEKAKVDLILRDFRSDGMDRRIAAVRSFAHAIETQFPGGKVEVEFTKQYLNMRQKLDQTPQVTELLFKAAELAGAKPYSKPIRGGTDGARLTEMGIPTPNLFAGMHNFHGRHEWASAAEMVQATDTILKLMELWTQT